SAGGVRAGEVGGVLAREARRMAFGDLPRKRLGIVALALADRRALAVDARALRRGVLLGQEAGNRDSVLVRVGEPVGRAELHRLDQMMEVIDRVVAGGLPGVSLPGGVGLAHLKNPERRGRPGKPTIPLNARTPPS